MSLAGELRDLAVDAAHAAGWLLRDRFGGPQSGLTAKSTRTDLVSDADRDAETLLVEAITGARPDDGIVAEEGSSAASASGVTWLVDPLDGTINYLWGIPHWSVSIAAADADGDLAAVVFDPNRDETFTATRGAGAFLGADRLTLTASTQVAEALVGTGFAYSADERARQADTLQGFLSQVRDIRRFGSAALDLAWVAAGRLDLFYETGLAPWDGAAGSMLVREAGGTVGALQMPGRPEAIVAARPGLDGPFRALLA